MPRIIPAFSQYFDGEGAMLSGGKLRFTISGTSTDKDTFSDLAESVANTNPVILDSEGRVPDVFGTDSYRATLYDSDDVQIDQFDPIPGSLTSTSALSDYLSTVTYGYKDLVVGSDGLFYQSLQADNLGNTPASGATSAYWSVVDFIHKWNSTKAYAVGDSMLYTDNQLYTCLVTTTAGQTPVTHVASWGLFSDLGGRTITDSVISESTLTHVGETINDLGTLTGGSVEIDWEDGSHIICTISTASQTFTFANWHALTADGGVIEITNGGSQVVTFTDAEWATGVAASLTVAGKDLLGVISSDGGTTPMMIAGPLDIS